MQEYFPSFRTVLTGGVAAFVSVLLTLGTARAGYLIEIDTDGMDDGVLTYNSHFSYGGDTTTASQSATSPAFGMTGGDSIYGGDGVVDPDTYVFTYDPSADADNLLIPGGQDLGGGILASGLTGGAPGLYAVFATWPSTANVSGGLTTFTVTTAGDNFSISLDQNGKGSDWIKLGEINWASGPITLTQEAGSNSFVSMRSAGALFEVVPEPSSISLGLLALASLGVWRRARKA